MFYSILWKKLARMLPKKPTFVSLSAITLSNGPLPPIFPVESDAEKRWFTIYPLQKFRSVVKKICNSRKYSSHFAIAEASYIKSPLFTCSYKEPVCLLCSNLYFLKSLGSF